MAMSSPVPLESPLSALHENRIILGDALEVLRSLPDACVDAIVTDPPYGLGAAPDMLDVLRAWLIGEPYQPRGRGFMGKSWDAFVPGPEYWHECLRVLRPGGHALVFAGTRTWDVMGLALRLAGFELRDTCQWLYGSGFPKSLDVSKQVDKMAGAKRPVKRIRRDGVGNTLASIHKTKGFAASRATVYVETSPATPQAEAWLGWGTALKPAWEPIIVCRKPLGEPTVAANVLRYGTGALNIGASRVGIEPIRTQGVRIGSGNTYKMSGYTTPDDWQGDIREGRWPANLLLSHAEDCVEGGPCSLWCPVRELDAQSGVTTSKRSMRGDLADNRSGHYANADGARIADSNSERGHSDTGGASRYFTTFRYQAKASRAERNRGCEGLPERGVQEYGTIRPNRAAGYDKASVATNSHPTVKPLALMSWLITLITPPGGVVLDPFAGSGSTLCAAKAGGWRYLGIEREAEYVAIAEARLAATSELSLGSATLIERPKPAKPKRERKPAKPTQPLWEMRA